MRDKDKRDAWLSTPRGRYYQQKCNAKQRCIDFNLTFEEWDKIWEGKYLRRGKAYSDLCMCRVGDTGAYEIGNVYIGTVAHNASSVAIEKKRTSCKITLEDANLIRKMILEGAMVKTCASLFGISRQSVSDIKARRTWL